MGYRISSGLSQSGRGRSQGIGGCMAKERSGTPSGTPGNPQKKPSDPVAADGWPTWMGDADPSLAPAPVRPKAVPRQAAPGRPAAAVQRSAPAPLAATPPAPAPERT